MHLKYLKYISLKLETCLKFYRKNYSHIPLSNFLFLFPKIRLEHNLIFIEFYFELSIEKYHCEEPKWSLK